MFTLFIRGAVLYVAMILIMRGLGKHQLGELQPFELAMTIMLADVISAPMESVATPLINGLLPVAAMLIVHSILSMAALKSDRVRAFVSGRPIVVVSKGVIDRDALARLCLSLPDLLEGLRAQGFMDPASVGTAIVEANGSISAFANSAARQPTAAEMNLDPGYEGMPLILIMDGRVQPANLSMSGQDAAWLKRLLADRGLAPARVYLASLDTKGLLTVQLMNGGILKIKALEPGKVAW